MLATRYPLLATFSQMLRTRYPLLFSQQIIGVQLVQRFRDKQPVLANEFSVEADFAATVFRTLDADHVPMHLRLVAVAHSLVSLARSEVEGSRDFFVEEDIAHRLENVRVESKREFADVARAGIAIEN